MAEESCVSREMMANAPPFPQTAGATLNWNGSSGACGEMASQALSTRARRPSFRIKGRPTQGNRRRPYWTTREIERVPAIPSQAIVWEQEAILMAFSLPPALLAPTAYTMLPGSTGEMMWSPWREQAAAPISAAHPVLLVQPPCASLQGGRVTITPALHPQDPLLHHMALVLQTSINGEDEAGWLYASALSDALAVHFLKRFAASQSALGQATNGLAPSKLQRVVTYIQDHLEQGLSLATLAAVAQTSPAHFARLFKQATGWTPHQYVTACRMESAKLLLAETEMPLSEIAPEVGCADQSHFTALFRKHASMTPQVYRNTTWR